MAVGGELDRGVEAGEQPAVNGWHGDSFWEGHERGAACHAAGSARSGPQAICGQRFRAGWRGAHGEVVRGSALLTAPGPSSVMN
jgi:hypothetical protein